MATIKDVAREADVSIATVSNYLNRTKPVSKQASEAIQKAIEKLKYSHNVMARNVRTKSSWEIGIILPDFDDSYYVQIFQGIKSYFQNTNYTVNLEFSGNVPENERKIVENFLKKRVCGLFLVSCQPNNWQFYYEHLTSQNIPLVLIDRNIHDLDANFVSFDNYNLMKTMSRQFLQKGYKKIYMMTGPHQYTCEAECVRGFREACAECGIVTNEETFIETDMSKEDAFRKTIRLLKSKKIDAVVTTSEALAKGVVEGFVVSEGAAETIPVATLSEEHWNHNTHSCASDFVVRAATKLGQTAAELMERQLAAPLARETEKIILGGSRICERSDVGNHEVKAAMENSRTLRLLLLDTTPVDALLGMKRNFENTTGIKVQVTSIPYADVYDTILRSYSEGAEMPYDIVMYAMPWLPFFVSQNMFYDITEDAEDLKERFFEKSLEHFGKVGGRCYGIPLIYGPQILYYRKDLFENPTIKAEYANISSISLRPPVTLKEFNTIADFFTNKIDAVPYGISIAAEESSCLSLEIYMRLLAYKGKIFDEQGNVCFDSEQTLKAYINFVRSLKYAKPNYLETNGSTAVEDFLAGETAMLISYPHFFTDVTDLRKNSSIGSIGYHMVPGGVPLLGGWGLGISSRSTQKKEALEFLRWTCSEQVAHYTVALGGQPPITSAYTNDALVNLYPWLQLYHSMNGYAEPIMPPVLKNGKVIALNEIDEVICKRLYQMMESDVEIVDVIKQTHSDLEELVMKYKSL